MKIAFGLGFRVISFLGSRRATEALQTEIHTAATAFLLDFPLESRVPFIVPVGIIVWVSLCQITEISLAIA